mmetsp:Transcript_35615/g.95455  ORF Transcript_35615/g.95455 Transcript_35615/m.95455 type:complete len:211 (+) Transcript_35615:1071-1703(+)
MHQSRISTERKKFLMPGGEAFHAFLLNLVICVDACRASTAEEVSASTTLLSSSIEREVWFVTAVIWAFRRASSTASETACFTSSRGISAKCSASKFRGLDNSGVIHAPAISSWSMETSVSCSAKPMYGERPCAMLIRPGRGTRPWTSSARLRSLALRSCLACSMLILGPAGLGLRSSRPPAPWLPLLLCIGFLRESMGRTCRWPLVAPEM